MEVSFTEDQENIRPSAAAAAATVFSPRGRMPFSDNVGFGYDDCGHDDSFMRFVDSPRAGLTLPVPLSFDDDEEEDDEDDKEDSGMDWQPLGVVAFRPSPSEPGPRTKSGGQRLASELLPRKPSAPPPSTKTSSGSRRQSCKRPSPSAARTITSRDNARTPSNNTEDCYSTTDDEDSECRRDSMSTKTLDEGKSAGSGGTPKRRRLARPLGDLTNSTTPTFGFKKPSLIQNQQQRLAALHRCSSEVTCGAAVDAPVRPTMHRQESVSTALDSARVDRAIASIDSLNLIGNSEQQHALPTVKELDYGIRHVTSATVSRLVNGEFADTVTSYAIIDCRYPYEFSGGHIRGAVNIYNQEELLRRFLEPVRSAGPAGRPAAATVLIFHCEFSSERAPKMARLLRQCDREANATNYPDLYYPEVYVLQGGYKAFYEHFKCNCQPPNYVKMVDPVYKAELAEFQRVGRAWERQNSRSRHSRLERLAAGDVLF